jgi:hypothetical protein
MEKTIKIFKQLSEKGYRAALSHTIEGLDELPINHPIKTAEMALVCEWLRVKYGIWVQVSILKDYEWHYSIRRKENNWNIEFPTKGTFKSPQEAYSAAFSYVLNNNLV